MVSREVKVSGRESWKECDPFTYESSP